MEFLRVFDELKTRCPKISMSLIYDNIERIWKLEVCRDEYVIFKIIGNNLELLFQNAYSKLQVHRWELER